MIGEISALITALFWTFSSLFFAEASKKIGSLQLNINRLILAFIFLGLTILIGGLSINLSTNQLLNLTLSGLIGLLFGDFFLFQAFAQIGARISMLIMSLAPVMAALLGFIFLDEKLTVTAIIGSIITISGIILVVTYKKEKEEHINAVGLFNAFLGALGQAVGLIFAKIAFNEGAINGFVATSIRIAASISIMLPIMLLMRNYKNPIKLYLKEKSAFKYTISGTIFGPFLGITASLIAVSNTEIGIASTLMATTPILMIPVVYILYKESIPLKSIVGTIIAILGVAILFLR